MKEEWNADGYTNNFQFVHEYGEDVLNLLEKESGAKILDLGCGNGALTQKLSEMGADAIGMDASGEMLAVARNLHPQLTFVQADATNFRLTEQVDAVFSNAVFHWIENQDGLLTSVAKALKPGGCLVCEFGGRGCAETIHLALEKAFEKRGLCYKRMFYFPTIGQYAPLLESHGLKVVYATLFDRPTKLTGENGMGDWIRMFVSQPFVGMESTLADTIIEEAVENLRPLLYRNGVWIADYVRIRFKAIKE